MRTKHAIIVLIITVLLSVATIVFYFYNKDRVTIPTNHVYLESEEFTGWMKEELNLNWAPTYLIIKDGKFISSIKGGIPVNTFESAYASAIADNNTIKEVPSIEITNIDNQTNNVSELFKNGVYILEISWVDCPDCIFQDENFTKDVYRKYGVKKIYRYYVNSSPDQVIEKYKKER